MPNTVPLGLERSQSMVELSLERRMREADVGSQSADTIKLGFSSCSNLWKQSSRTRSACYHRCRVGSACAFRYQRGKTVRRHPLQKSRWPKRPSNAAGFAAQANLAEIKA